MKSKPIDKEAVRVLAIEIGAREAARKLGISEDTVCSWSRRLNWKLPKHVPALKLQACKQLQAGENVGDVVLQGLKEREANTRTHMSIAAERGAQEAAQLDAVLPAAAQLQALGAFVARTFGWASGAAPSVNYYGDVNTVVVCDEKRRAELIAQRERLLEEQSKGTVIEVR